MDDGDSFPAGE